MHNFKSLNIWKKSMAFAKRVFLFSKQLPKEELFGLTYQIRRSACSIPSNIAEGSSRGTDRHFIQYLSIALGSAFELETLILLASDFDYLHHEKEEEMLEQLHEIQQMISGFIKKLEKTD